MPLTREDVAGIADYARIALTPEELDEMTAYMNSAIDLLEPIRQYDLEGVEPTFHPIGDLSNVMADDVPDTEVRHCAFVRGSAIVGKGAVVGNSTELKNVLIFNHVEVPHYNYVGDSILGYRSHMGAGSITSNIKADRKNIEIRVGNEKIATGMRKIGAILGDYVEIGCGAVLNPGSVIGHHTNVYPLSMVRGYVEKESIYKKQGEVVAKE